MNEVSILIPTRYNSLLIIDLCLRSIRKYTDHPYRIIVGDAGVDKETADFLKQQSDVSVVKCPDPLRPKNHLARVVETPYFLFLHDDAHILRPGWLKRRLAIMEHDSKIGFVGPIGYNYGIDPGWRQYISLSPLLRRFFPFAFLVRAEAQVNLDLFWGKLCGFDNGAIAYIQYRKRLITGGNRKKWKHKNYNYLPDVKHWKGMTWPLRKADKQEKLSPEVKSKLHERDTKLEEIRKILESESY